MWFKSISTHRVRYMVELYALLHEISTFIYTRHKPMQCMGKKKINIVKNTISLLRTQMIKLKTVHCELIVTKKIFHNKHTLDTLPLSNNNSI